VGCHWYLGDDYCISTVSGGGLPSGYVVFYRRQEITDRLPTLQEAQRIGEAHALRWSGTGTRTSTTKEGS
jgi:hypothetical protein